MRTLAAISIAGLSLVGGLQSSSVVAQVGSVAASEAPTTVIQDLCLDSGAVWDKALPKLQARAQGNAIREEKLGKATVYHLDLSEALRVELTVANADNAIMSCTVHAQVADVKATFTDMQKRYHMKGALADYLLGKPTRNVPFVPQVAGKPGRKMMGLFEFHQADGQAGGMVQAVILRDEAAAGPPPIKTSAAETKTAKPGAAKKPVAKTAAAKAKPASGSAGRVAAGVTTANPITTGSIPAGRN